jgi:predicted phage replisome organizer
MPGVPWIKLWTGIFDDEKIKIIQALPEGDTIVLCWLRLLCMAGKCGQGGTVAISEAIPYTDDMLSSIWGVQVSTVRLAIDTLSNLGMILVEEDGLMLITNWGRYQSVRTYEEVQQGWKERKRKQRSGRKIPDVTGQSRDSHGTDCDMSRDVTLQEVEDRTRSKEVEKEQEVGVVWKTEQDLCQSLWSIFEKRHNAFIPNPHKEANAVTQLIHAAEQSSQKPGETRTVLAGMVKQFKELKDTDNSKGGFWRSQPFLPSTLVTHWARVWEAAKMDAIDHDDIEELFPDE